MCRTIISLPEFRWLGYFQKKVKRSARKKLEIFIRTVFRKMNMSFTEAAVQSSSTKQSILKKKSLDLKELLVYVLFFSIVSAWRLKTFVTKILACKLFLDDCIWFCQVAKPISISLLTWKSIERSGKKLDIIYFILVSINSKFNQMH